MTAQYQAFFRRLYNHDNLYKLVRLENIDRLTMAKWNEEESPSNTILVGRTVSQEDLRRLMAEIPIRYLPDAWRFIILDLEEKL